MGDGNLRKPDLFGDLGRPRFVVVIAIAVHEDDGHRANTKAVGIRQVTRQSLFIERLKLLALGAQALVGLDDALIDLAGQDDVAGENVGPVLIADSQSVGEAPGDDENRAVAGALEQRVGGHRGAHLDRIDAGRRDRLISPQAEQVANALQGRVVVMLGILRQQFMGDQPAVGPPGDDVRKGPAAIDPELPALRGWGRGGHGPVFSSL